MLQREPSVRRPPSIDGARKPRRSESELPDSAVVAAARKEAAEKAAAASGAPAPITGMKVRCCSLFGVLLLFWAVLYTPCLPLCLCDYCTGPLPDESCQRLRDAVPRLECMHG